MLEWIGEDKCGSGSPCRGHPGLLRVSPVGIPQTPLALGQPLGRDILHQQREHCWIISYF